MSAGPQRSPSLAASSAEVPGFWSRLRQLARTRRRAAQPDSGQRGAAGAEEPPVRDHLHPAADLRLGLVADGRGPADARRLLRPSGPFMLTGYYVVLAVPLLLIVPFVAFRSLAAEREDGTYELLSITTLSSRQIVTGKLGSAILQMLVYYSALSPCIAFTYLLRGIDILTIVLLLGYTFLASLLLCGRGPAGGGRAREPARAGPAVGGAADGPGGAHRHVVRDRRLGDASNARSCRSTKTVSGSRKGVILSFYVSYLVLFVLAAAAQLSFASDNRSTKLRIVMLVQQLLLTGWCCTCG